MSYYNQPSSYPGAPQQQSSYPGGPGFPTADTSGAVGFPGQHNAQQDYQYSSPSDYGADRGANHVSGASSYYSGGQHGALPHNQQQQQDGEVQYDEHGNPIPGERGVGTMAMGALGGFAVNKMSGNNHGKLASAGTGALLAQGAKMAMDHYKKNKNKQSMPQQGYQSPYGYQAGPGHHGSHQGGHHGGHYNSHQGGSGGGGFLGGFGKREA